MLRNRADRSSITCLLASAAGQMAWLATGKLVFLVPMIVALRWTALVQHNHSHLSLFRRGPANRLVDLALGPVTGMPMELYREAHERTHHRHLGTPQDWTQPTQVHGGVALQERPLSHHRYLYVFLPRAGVQGWRSIRQDLGQTKRLLAEVAVFGALVLLPVLAGTPSRLLPLALQWVVVAVLSAHANYGHHDGYLEADRRKDHANDNYNLRHTSLGFNIGYHTAHHRRPNAHWSKLPDLWAKQDGTHRETASRPAS